LFNETLYSEELSLLNSTGLYSEWAIEFDPFAGVNWTLGGENVWVDFMEPLTGNKISATLCFKYRWAANYNVTIHRTWNKTEPTLKWNTAGQSYVIGGIRRMLKATLESATLEERGIMDLSRNLSDRDNVTLNFAVTASGFSTDSDLEAADPDNNINAIMCTYCSSNGPRTIDPHRFHIVLFQDIITSTGNT